MIANGVPGFRYLLPNGTIALRRVEEIARSVNNIHDYSYHPVILGIVALYLPTEMEGVSIISDTSKPPTIRFEINRQCPLVHLPSYATQNNHVVVACGDDIINHFKSWHVAEDALQCRWTAYFKGLAIGIHLQKHNCAEQQYDFGDKRREDGEKHCQIFPRNERIWQEMMEKRVWIREYGQVSMDKRVWPTTQGWWHGQETVISTNEIAMKEEQDTTKVTWCFHFYNLSGESNLTRSCTQAADWRATGKFPRLSAGSPCVVWYIWSLFAIALIHAYPDWNFNRPDDFHAIQSVGFVDLLPAPSEVRPARCRASSWISIPERTERWRGSWDEESNNE